MAKGQIENLNFCIKIDWLYNIKSQQIWKLLYHYRFGHSYKKSLGICRDFEQGCCYCSISYLWGILGQWDILLLNLTSIVFTHFFRCLIFDLSFFTNADVVTIKDETSKENLWNWCRSYWLPLVSRIFLDVSSLSFSFLQMLMM